MADVFLTGDLLGRGHPYGEIARMHRRGELVRVRRGAWTSSGSDDAVDVVERHRRLVAATSRMVSSDAVLSHASAAVLHGLPVWSESLAQVCWTRSRRGGGRARAQVHVYAAHVDPHEVVVVDGFSITSLERTVVDLARHSPFRRGVMTADAALRLGLPQSTLSESVASAAHRPGAAKARRVVAFADPLAESPGESWSRVELAEIGWAPSHLQYEVIDRYGVLVGRADFCWEKQRILGEFDGKIKYGRALNPGQSVEDVVYREKRREDALRDEGWQVVRWGTDDLRTPKLLAERLGRAAARSSRASSHT